MGHKESYKYLNLKILTQIIWNIFTVAMGCLEPRLAAEMNFKTLKYQWTCGL